MPLPRITALTLNVTDPEKLAAFYCDIMGMRRSDEAGTVTVGYDGEGAKLELVASPVATPYRHGRNDRYWKIAITVPDLDLAYEQLAAHGISVTPPGQFRDIAYMSHLADPEGHIIELIQHTFQGKPLTRKGNGTLPLGGGARIGLITLRTDDIDAELVRCRDELGMSYLSRQDLPDLEFCLYFLAFTTETPPQPDPNAVENREWLWQRPYTVLEFQHRLQGSINVPLREAKGAAAVKIDQRGYVKTVLR